MDIIRNDKIVEIKDMLFDKLKQDISFLEKRITIQNAPFQIGNMQRMNFIL